MDYQKECLRTLPEGMSKMDVLAMCALGLCGETAEAYQELRYGTVFKDTTCLMLEIGDAMYYAAVALNALGRELTSPTDRLRDCLMGTYDARNAEYEAVTAMRDSCKAADVIKKLRYHGHELDESAEYEPVTLLDYILLALGAIANKFDHTVEQVQQMNIDKLRLRYPDGFSTERSVNREEG